MTKNKTKVPIMSRTRILLVPAILAALFTFAAPAVAENEGQADLDKATELKLTGEKMADLQEVIRLCESALKKGLDKDNTDFAKQMLSATLYQRADVYCRSIFEQRPPSKKWPQLRGLAMADLEKSLGYDDTQGAAHLLVARLSILPGGDNEKAAKAVDKAIALLTDDDRRRSEALVLRGALTKDDPKRRFADFDAAVKADPNNVKALRIRGFQYLAQEEFEKAIADLTKATELEPRHGQTWQAVAEALAGLKKYEEAIERLDAAVKLAPISPALFLMRARLHAMNENIDAALADTNEAIKLDKRSIAVLMLRARLWMMKENVDEAMKDVDRVLELEPGDRPAIMLRSLLLAEKGNFQGAISAIEGLLRDDPENVELQMQLASLHNADKRPRKAIEILSKIIDADEENARARRRRADAQLSIGGHAQAIADYEAALRLEPDNKTMLNNFAWVLATSPDDKLRDGRRAIELATKACEVTEYKQAHILSTLAAAYAETGDFKSAKKWIEKAAEIADKEVEEPIRNERESYEKKKPWRERQETKERPEHEPPKPGDFDLERDLHID